MNEEDMNREKNTIRHITTKSIQNKLIHKKLKNNNQSTEYNKPTSFRNKLPIAKEIYNNYILWTRN
jgi:hypothetical protein